MVADIIIERFDNFVLWIYVEKTGAAIERPIPICFFPLKGLVGEIVDFEVYNIAFAIYEPISSTST